MNSHDYNYTNTQQILVYLRQPHILYYTIRVHRTAEAAIAEYSYYYSYSFRWH
jgi:hypothetical protein